MNFQVQSAPFSSRNSHKLSIAQTYGHNKAILTFCKGNSQAPKHKMKGKKFNVFLQKQTSKKKNQRQMFVSQKKSRNFALAFEHKQFIHSQIYLHYVLGFCKEARNLWTVRRV